MPENPKPRLAILYDHECKLSPSNPAAINKFITTAVQAGFHVEIISRVDWYRLFEFDALFIRETTAIGNHVHDMAMMAENLGLVVIDDPKSIEIGCDKAEQFKLFQRHHIPIPKTFIVTEDNLLEPCHKIDSPYILKNPHGCFSNGVYKGESPLAYQQFALAMLEKLDRIVVQEFIQTDFDWRIGVLNNAVIFGCKYYMTKGHWKIIKHNRNGEFVDGESDAVPLHNIPPLVCYWALKAASLLGSGFYGVDIKQTRDGLIYVIEVNDSPNVDAGVEDILGDSVYSSIIQFFQLRLSQQVCLLASRRSIPGACQLE